MSHSRKRKENPSDVDTTWSASSDDTKTLDDLAIGIDLGTTFSCVAVVKDDRVHIISNSDGQNTTPSYVSFDETERLVGGPAYNQAIINPVNTVFDAKRMIGRGFTDPEMQEDMKLWPFHIVNQHDRPVFEVRYQNQTKYFLPEEISAAILRKLKEDAEGFLGHDVAKAVITVPAYFNDAQRSSTKAAAEIAGLKVLRIINEPTAAALAYGLQTKRPENEQTVLIFDLGGGTFDVSLLSIHNQSFVVKATAGDTHLGGRDFDDLLVKHCLEELKKKKADLSMNAKAMRRLRNTCESAKRTLSSCLTASVIIDSPTGEDFCVKITRTQFEDMCQPLFEKVIQLVDKVLVDAKVSKTQIDEIVLVGGSTRIPKVQGMLVSHFHGKTLCKSINADEAVAYGAAVQAAMLTGKMSSVVPKEMMLVDVTPLSLGVGTNSGEMEVIISRNTIIPCRQSHMFTTGDDNITTLRIEIFQGERRMAADNKRLGKFLLSGIRLAKRGIPKVEVALNIDDDGILTVTAIDKHSGNVNGLTITKDALQLSKSQIDKMINDAETFKVADKQREEAILAKTGLQKCLLNLQRKTKTDEFKALSVDDRMICTGTIERITKWMDDNPDTHGDYYKSMLVELQDGCVKMEENSTTSPERDQ